MRKILFSWNGLNVYSYPAMLYFGMLAGVFAGAHVAQTSGMDANLVLIPLSEHWETASGAGIIIVPNVHSRSRP